MNNRDANRILGILAANYPDTDTNKDDAAYIKKVELWAACFAEEPFEVVLAAVQAYIVNNPARFAPNIGRVKEQIRQLTQPNELAEAEAWALVLKAISRSGYEAKAEFDKLPPLVQKVVGSPNQLREWGLMNSETVQSVVASNFQRGYRTMQEREAALQKTPPAIRDMFAAMTKPMELPTAEAPALSKPKTDEATRRALEEHSKKYPELGIKTMEEFLAAMREAAGEIVITEDKKAAALEKLRDYGKEDA